MVARKLTVTDMNTHEIFGPEFHRLSFAEAVSTNKLCDYHLVVLGVDRSLVGKDMLRSETIKREEEGVSTRDVHEHMTRAFGTVLAINGFYRDEKGRDVTVQPLRRVIAFSNTRKVSQRFAEVLRNPSMKGKATQRMGGKDMHALRIKSRHLDARSSAHERAIQLDKLRRADNEDVARVLCNVGLFSEGVDVPALDAISFLEPRRSPVDIVQAVGRVMRKAEGKSFGYVIVPIVLSPGESVMSALNTGGHGYEHVGQVLRALAAHDSRLADEGLATALRDHLTITRVANGNGHVDEEDGYGVIPFELEDIRNDDVYAIIASASGFATGGTRIANSIINEVTYAGLSWYRSGVDFASAVGHPPAKSEQDEKNTCKTAALLVVNACLLHKRLSAARPGAFASLKDLKLSASPRGSLAEAWKEILKVDYRPVFGPALQCVLRLPPRGDARHGLMRLMEYAEEEAESLNELGYDHAGPLYHKVLPSASSGGAFYTKPVSAMLLAGLALPQDGHDWSRWHDLERLRICDPACGSGTLLMATLSRIKALATKAAESKPTHESLTHLHQGLVENVFCGLDINKVAVQLAACNLTLGAPMTEYRRMHLYTMAHGVDQHGVARGGSIDLIAQAEDDCSLHSFALPPMGIDSAGGEHIENGSASNFPIRNLDLVIMNPPFTANKNRNEAMGKEGKKAMQAHELFVRDTCRSIDPKAGELLSANAIRTYFTPLADQLLDRRSGSFAVVYPTTACTSPEGISERIFLASRFHIEWLVTSHDPGRPAFSDSTGIHETLLIARRWPGTKKPATKIAALREFPEGVVQASQLADALTAGKHVVAVGSVWHWPVGRIRRGSWNAVVWSNAEIAECAEALDEWPGLTRLDAVSQTRVSGRRCSDAYRKCSPNEPGIVIRMVFSSVSAHLRTRIEGEPEQCMTPQKTRLAEKYWACRSRLLVAHRLDARSGRIIAAWSPQATLGTGFMPVEVESVRYEQALCAWLNSTVGLLQMLNKRARKLTYPKWNPALWRSVKVPRPANTSLGALVEAFQQARKIEVARLDNLAECPVRPILDAAAAKVLGISEGEITDWRHLLAKEPTLSGKRMAPQATRVPVR